MTMLFRLIGYLEGTSYLALLLIAMPLKYMWGIPEAVRMVGWAHGGLFVLYCLLAIIMWRQHSWSFKTLALAFVSSILPAGPFVFDRKVFGSSAK